MLVGKDTVDVVDDIDGPITCEALFTGHGTLFVPSVHASFVLATAQCQVMPTPEMVGLSLFADGGPIFPTKPKTKDPLQATGPDAAKKPRKFVVVFMSLAFALLAMMPRSGVQSVRINARIAGTRNTTCVALETAMPPRMLLGGALLPAAATMPPRMLRKAVFFVLPALAAAVSPLVMPGGALLPPVPHFPRPARRAATVCVVSCWYTRAGQATPRACETAPRCASISPVPWVAGPARRVHTRPVRQVLMLGPGHTVETRTEQTMWIYSFVWCFETWVSIVILQSV